MLAGETSPWQRRDAAVLLFHVGQLDQAACELDAYVSTSHFRTSTFQERQTVEKLMAAIRGHPGAIPFHGIAACTVDPSQPHLLLCCRLVYKMNMHWTPSWSNDLNL